MPGYFQQIIIVCVDMRSESDFSESNTSEGLRSYLAKPQPFFGHVIVVHKDPLLLAPY